MGQSFPCTITEVLPANAAPPTDPPPPYIVPTLTLNVPMDSAFSGIAADTAVAVGQIVQIGVVPSFA